MEFTVLLIINSHNPVSCPLQMYKIKMNRFMHDVSYEYLAFPLNFTKEFSGNVIIWELSFIMEV